MKEDKLKIGQYAIHAVETGNFWLDDGAMFGVEKP
jgi:hypothetical protein